MAKPPVDVELFFPDPRRRADHPLPVVDVHHAIGPCGIACQFGRPVRERALLLIELAPSNLRPALPEQGKRMGDVPMDQTLRNRSGDLLATRMPAVCASCMGQAVAS